MESSVFHPLHSCRSHRIILKSLIIVLFFAFASLHSWNQDQGSLGHARRGLAEVNGTVGELIGINNLAEQPGGLPENAEESNRQCRAVRSRQRSERCRLAKIHCQASAKSFVNYVALHFCELKGQAWLSVPLLVVIVILAFYILAETAEQHFSPVVGRMVEMLHLSPSMGGVTLLALGNGAPDVFASIAAVGGGNARIGLGAILSAGTFVTAFVVGFVALAAGPFSVKPFPFVRDVCFYMVGASLLFFVYISGGVYLWQAVGFVIFYIFFVVVVLCMDQVGGRGRVQKAFNSAGFELAEVQPDHDNTSRKPKRIVEQQGCRDVEAVVTEDSAWVYKQENGVSRMPDVASMNGASNAIEGMVDAATKGIGTELLLTVTDSMENQEERKPSKSIGDGLMRGISSLLCCKRQDCHEGKFGLVWLRPVEMMLRSTIPAVDPSKWNRFYAAGNVVLCPLVLLYLFSSIISPTHRIIFLLPKLNLPIWTVILVQASFLGVAYFFSMRDPPQKEHPFAVVVAFVMSVFWISFIAGELLGCLAALGLVLELPPSLLGLTVLAWGNSMGDLVTDVAVARAGQPAMAVAGCFAGPMFNMLIGMGLALAMRTANVHPSYYHLDYNYSIIIAFGFLFTSLLGSLFVVIWSRFKVPRFWGFCLIALYTMFMIVSVSIASVQ